MNIKEVELLSVGYYLPVEPIAFDKIEDNLGDYKNIDEGLKARIKKYKGMMGRILKACCYFAIAPQTKRRQKMLRPYR